MASIAFICHPAKFGEAKFPLGLGILISAVRH